MRDVYRQEHAGIRFDWGLSGALALEADDAALVVVDVLSFTTAVSVATSRGMSVIPYRWRDQTAASFAKSKNAALAVGRSEQSTSAPWSLSPAALLVAPLAERLVLPSPNGSTISALGRGLIIAASLRNSGAVATRLVEAGYGTQERPVIVVAAGERWTSDDSLRPAVEDMLGAGAVINGLAETRAGELSAESMIARASYCSTPSLAVALKDCASGRELIADGYGSDVNVASDHNSDTVVPVLINGAFCDVRSVDELRRIGLHQPALS